MFIVGVSIDIKSLIVLSDNSNSILAQKVSVNLYIMSKPGTIHFDVYIKLTLVCTLAWCLDIGNLGTYWHRLVTLVVVFRFLSQNFEMW